MMDLFLKQKQHVKSPLEKKSMLSNYVELGISINGPEVFSCPLFATIYVLFEVAVQLFLAINHMFHCTILIKVDEKI